MIGESYMYDLYGICNHVDSPTGGHYNADVKTSDSGIWYHYDDSRFIFLFFLE